MEPLYWQRKFDAAITFVDGGDGFNRYRIENETGAGTITACTVFPGLQALSLDLHMGRCNKLMTLDKEVIEIGYCLDGRFECNVSPRYNYYASAGNFSVGYAGKKESHGTFPTGFYRGNNIFLDDKTFSRQQAGVLQDMDIRMERIRALADVVSRCFVLRHSPEMAMIQEAMAEAFRSKSVPRMRVKVIELLMFLSELDVSTVNESPVYLNKSLVALAKSAQALIADDVSTHTRIEMLAARLNVGATTLKTAFRSVYGIPIYQYQKDLRLQMAQQLLRETDLPVFAIAAKVGYVNPAKFSSAFKKRFGISPTDYKKQNT